MTPSAFAALLPRLPTAFRPVLRPDLPFSEYVRIDLSPNGVHALRIDVADPVAMEAAIQHYCTAQNATLAYGGYLEYRTLYQRSAHFAGSEAEPERNVHLGVDFWVAAGTAVVAPLEGQIHSLRDNAGLGNYGPTIVVEHRMDAGAFYTLYGHLSRASLEGWAVGQAVAAGHVLGTLGEAAVNGTYAPHLHFQVVLDLGEWWGDYPGVCAVAEVEQYASQCPDPMRLLGA